MLSGYYIIYNTDDMGFAIGQHKVHMRPACHREQCRRGNARGEEEGETEGMEG